MDTEVKISSIDPIRVSVIGSRLDAISKEIGQTMLRTSRSPIFSEARDFVTGIFDKDLRLVAQTAYIPVLMGALPYAIRSIAETFAGDVNEGDIFILNDPQTGFLKKATRISGRYAGVTTPTSGAEALPGITLKQEACGKSASVSRRPSYTTRASRTRHYGTPSC